ncbi:MAG: sigma-70 family RNA polymerase sigma factor, partial [Candidatus Omnitrophica bacterium]|nr:sigma-70 family RNA polymerase sigma factor [Candidatus Omnitrophota bacterium]
MSKVEERLEKRWREGGESAVTYSALAKSYMEGGDPALLRAIRRLRREGIVIPLANGVQLMAAERMVDPFIASLNTYYSMNMPDESYLAGLWNRAELEGAKEASDLFTMALLPLVREVIETELNTPIVLDGRSANLIVYLLQRGSIALFERRGEWPTPDRPETLFAFFREMLWDELRSAKREYYEEIEQGENIASLDSAIYREERKAETMKDRLPSKEASPVDEAIEHEKARLPLIQRREKDALFDALRHIIEDEDVFGDLAEGGKYKWAVYVIGSLGRLGIAVQGYSDLNLVVLSDASEDRIDLCLDKIARRLHSELICQRDTMPVVGIGREGMYKTMLSDARMGRANGLMRKYCLALDDAHVGSYDKGFGTIEAVSVNDTVEVRRAHVRILSQLGVNGFSFSAGANGIFLAESQDGVHEALCDRLYDQIQQATDLNAQELIERLEDYFMETQREHMYIAERIREERARESAGLQSAPPAVIPWLWRPIVNYLKAKGWKHENIAFTCGFAEEIAIGAIAGLIHLYFDLTATGGLLYLSVMVAALFTGAHLFGVYRLEDGSLSERGPPSLKDILSIFTLGILTRAIYLIPFLFIAAGIPIYALISISASLVLINSIIHRVYNSDIAPAIKTALAMSFGRESQDMASFDELRTPSRASRGMAKETEDDDAEVAQKGTSLDSLDSSLPAPYDREIDAMVNVLCRVAADPSRWNISIKMGSDGVVPNTAKTILHNYRDEIGRITRGLAAAELTNALDERREDALFAELAGFLKEHFISQSIFMRYAGQLSDFRETFSAMMHRKIARREKVMNIAVSGPGFLQGPIEILAIADQCLSYFPDPGSLPAVKVHVFDYPYNGLKEKMLQNAIIYDPADVAILSRYGIDIDKYFVRAGSGYRLREEIHKRFDFDFIDLNDPESLSTEKFPEQSYDIIFFNQVFQYLADARVQRRVMERLSVMLRNDGILYASGLTGNLRAVHDFLAEQPHLDDLWERGGYGEIVTKLYKTGYGPGPYLMDPRGTQNERKVSVQDEAAFSATPRRVKTDPNMASFDEAQDAIPSDSRGMAGEDAENISGAEELVRKALELMGKSIANDPDGVRSIILRASAKLNDSQEHDSLTETYKGDVAEWAEDLRDPNSPASYLLIDLMPQTLSTGLFRYPHETDVARQVARQEIGEAMTSGSEARIDVFIPALCKGDEAASIALAIFEEARKTQGFDWRRRLKLKITGIDIDSRLISKASERLKGGFGILDCGNPELLASSNRTLAEIDDIIRQDGEDAPVRFDLKTMSVVDPAAAAYLENADIVSVNHLAFDISSNAKKVLVERLFSMKPGSVLLSSDLASTGSYSFYSADDCRKVEEAFIEIYRDGQESAWRKRGERDETPRGPRRKNQSPDMGQAAEADMDLEISPVSELADTMSEGIARFQGVDLSAIEHKTYFYRHLEKRQYKDAFDALIDNLVEKVQSGQGVRILSAGCSSGEEAYTIALELLDRGVPPDKIKIVGIDKDDTVIRAARDGQYGENAFSGKTPLHVREKYFDFDAGQNAYKISGSIKNSGMVSFEICDLRDTEDVMRSGQFDAIVYMMTDYQIGSVKDKEAIMSSFRAVSAEDGLLLTDCASNEQMLFNRSRRSKTGFKVSTLAGMIFGGPDELKNGGKSSAIQPQGLSVTMIYYSSFDEALKALRKNIIDPAQTTIPMRRRFLEILADSEEINKKDPGLLMVKDMRTRIAEFGGNSLRKLLVYYEEKGKRVAGEALAELKRELGITARKSPSAIAKEPPYESFEEASGALKNGVIKWQRVVDAPEIELRFIMALASSVNKEPGNIDTGDFAKHKIAELGDKTLSGLLSYYVSGYGTPGLALKALKDRHKIADLLPPARKKIQWEERTRDWGAVCDILNACLGAGVNETTVHGYLEKFGVRFDLAIDLAMGTEAHDRRNGAAVEAFVEAYLGLIIRNARVMYGKYKPVLPPDISIEDFIQEGRVCVMRCAQGYDPKEGKKFLSYAIPALIHRFVNFAKAKIRKRGKEISDYTYEDGSSVVATRATRDGTPRKSGNVDDIVGRMTDEDGGDFIRKLLAGKVPDRDIEIYLLYLRPDATLRGVGYRYGLTRQRIGQIVKRCRAIIKNYITPKANVSGPKPSSRSAAEGEKSNGLDDAGAVGGLTFIGLGLAAAAALWYLADIMAFISGLPWNNAVVYASLAGAGVIAGIFGKSGEPKYPDEGKSESGKDKLISGLKKFGVEIKNGAIDFDGVPDQSDEDWFMDEERRDERGPIITTLDDMPDAGLKYSIEDMMKLPALSTEGKTSQGVYIGLIESGGIEMPAAIKMIRRPPDLLRQELICAQAIDRLGIGPRFYGVIRDASGNITGYAMQVVIGRPVEQAKEDKEYVEECGYLLGRLAEIGLCGIINYMLTRKGEIVVIDAGNLDIIGETLFDRFREKITEGVPAADSWDIIPNVPELSIVPPGFPELSPELSDRRAYMDLKERRGGFANQTGLLIKSAPLIVLTSLIVYAYTGSVLETYLAAGLAALFVILSLGAFIDAHRAFKIWLEKQENGIPSNKSVRRGNVFKIPAVWLAGAAAALYKIFINVIRRTREYHERKIFTLSSAERKKALEEKSALYREQISGLLRALNELEKKLPSNLKLFGEAVDGLTLKYPEVVKMRLLNNEEVNRRLLKMRTAVKKAWRREEEDRRQALLKGKEAIRRAEESKRLDRLRMERQRLEGLKRMRKAERAKKEALERASGELKIIEPFVEVPAPSQKVVKIEEKPFDEEEIGKAKNILSDIKGFLVDISALSAEDCDDLLRMLEDVNALYLPQGMKDEAKLLARVIDERAGQLRMDLLKPARAEEGDRRKELESKRQKLLENMPPEIDEIFRSALTAPTLKAARRLWKDSRGDRRARNFRARDDRERRMVQDALEILKKSGVIYSGAPGQSIPEKGPGELGAVGGLTFIGLGLAAAAALWYLADIMAFISGLPWNNAVVYASLAGAGVIAGIFGAQDGGVITTLPSMKTGHTKYRIVVTYASNLYRSQFLRLMIQDYIDKRGWGKYFEVISAGTSSDIYIVKGSIKRPLVPGSWNEFYCLDRFDRMLDLLHADMAGHPALPEILEYYKGLRKRRLLDAQEIADADVILRTETEGDGNRQFLVTRFLPKNDKLFGYPVPDMYEDGTRSCGPRFLYNLYSQMLNGNLGNALGQAARDFEKAPSAAPRRVEDGTSMTAEDGPPQSAASFLSALHKDEDGVVPFKVAMAIGSVVSLLFAVVSLSLGMSMNAAMAFGAAVVSAFVYYLASGESAAKAREKLQLEDDLERAIKTRRMAIEQLDTWNRELSALQSAKNPDRNRIKDQINLITAANRELRSISLRVAELMVKAGKEVGASVKVGMVRRRGIFVAEVLAVSTQILPELRDRALREMTRRNLFIAGAAAALGAAGSAVVYAVRGIAARIFNTVDVRIGNRVVTVKVPDEAAGRNYSYIYIVVPGKGTYVVFLVKEKDAEIALLEEAKRAAFDKVRERIGRDVSSAEERRLLGMLSEDLKIRDMNTVRLFAAAPLDGAPDMGSRLVGETIYMPLSYLDNMETASTALIREALNSLILRTGEPGMTPEKREEKALKIMDVIFAAAAALTAESVSGMAKVIEITAPEGSRQAQALSGKIFVDTNFELQEPNENNDAHLREREAPAIIRDFLVRDNCRNLRALSRDLFGREISMDDVRMIDIRQFQEGIFLHIFKGKIVLENGEAKHFVLNMPTGFGSENDLAVRDYHLLSEAHGRHPDEVVRPILLGRGFAPGRREWMNIFALEYLQDYVELNPVYIEQPRFVLNPLGRYGEAISQWKLEVSQANSEAVLRKIVETFAGLMEYDEQSKEIRFIAPLSLRSGDFMLNPMDPDKPLLKLITIRDIQTGNSTDLLDYLLGNHFVALGPDMFFRAEVVLEGVTAGLAKKFGHDRGAAIWKEWMRDYRETLKRRAEELNILLDGAAKDYPKAAGTIQWLERMVMIDKRLHAISDSLCFRFYDYEEPLIGDIVEKTKDPDRSYSISYDLRNFLIRQSALMAQALKAVKVTMASGFEQALRGNRRVSLLQADVASANSQTPIPPSGPAARPRPRRKGQPPAPAGREKASLTADEEARIAYGQSIERLSSHINSVNADTDMNEWILEAERLLDEASSWARILLMDLEEVAALAKRVAEIMENNGSPPAIIPWLMSPAVTYLKARGWRGENIAFTCGLAEEVGIGAIAGLIHLYFDLTATGGLLYLSMMVAALFTGAHLFGVYRLEKGVLSERGPPRLKDILSIFTLGSLTRAIYLIPFLFMPAGIPIYALISISASLVLVSSAIHGVYNSDISEWLGTAMGMARTKADDENAKSGYAEAMQYIKKNSGLWSNQEFGNSTPRINFISKFGSSGENMIDFKCVPGFAVNEWDELRGGHRGEEWGDTNHYIRYIDIPTEGDSQCISGRIIASPSFEPIRIILHKPEEELFVRGFGSRELSSLLAAQCAATIHRIMAEIGNMPAAGRIIIEISPLIREAFVKNGVDLSYTFTFEEFSQKVKGGATQWQGAEPVSAAKVEEAGTLAFYGLPQIKATKSGDGNVCLRLPGWREYRYYPDPIYEMEDEVTGLDDTEKHMALKKYLAENFGSLVKAEERVVSSESHREFSDARYYMEAVISEDILGDVAAVLQRFFSENFDIRYEMIKRDLRLCNTLSIRERAAIAKRYLLDYSPLGAILSNFNYKTTVEADKFLIENEARKFIDGAGLYQEEAKILDIVLIPRLSYPLAVNLKEITPAYRAGNKSNAFWRFNSLQLNYPEGAAIPAPVVTSIANGNTELLETLTDEVMGILDIRAEGEMFASIEDPSRPVELAVRSSPEASMPGRLDTVLEINGRDALRQAILDVISSWNSPRAKSFRQARNIHDALRLGIVVEKMVYGALNDNSASGVVCSRNPNTAENAVFGSYLPRSRCADIVSGKKRGMPIDRMAEKFPLEYQTLIKALEDLEKICGYPQQVEFVIQDGVLYFIQTRDANLMPQAEEIFINEISVSRPAGDMAAMRRILKLNERIGSRKLYRLKDGINVTKLLESDIATNGAMAGRAVFSAEKAVSLGQQGEGVILISVTPADDIIATVFSLPNVGLVTAYGDGSSHEAELARLAGIPAMIGIQGMRLEEDTLTCRSGAIKEGDFIVMSCRGGEGFVGRADAEDILVEDRCVKDASYGVDIPYYRGKYLTPYLTPGGEIKENVSIHRLRNDNVCASMKFQRLKKSGAAIAAFIANLEKHFMHELYLKKAAKEGVAESIADEELASEITRAEKEDTGRKGILAGAYIEVSTINTDSGPCLVWRDELEYYLDGTESRSFESVGVLHDIIKKGDVAVSKQLKKMVLGKIGAIVSAIARSVGKSKDSSKNPPPAIIPWLMSPAVTYLKARGWRGENIAFTCGLAEEIGIGAIAGLIHLYFDLTATGGLLYLSMMVAALFTGAHLSGVYRLEKGVLSERGPPRLKDILSIFTLGSLTRAIYLIPFLFMPAGIPIYALISISASLVLVSSAIHGVYNSDISEWLGVATGMAFLSGDADDPDESLKRNLAMVAASSAKEIWEQAKTDIWPSPADITIETLRTKVNGKLKKRRITTRPLNRKGLLKIMDSREFGEFLGRENLDYVWIYRPRRKDSAEKLKEACIAVVSLKKPAPSEYRPGSSVRAAEEEPLCDIDESVRAAVKIDDEIQDFARAVKDSDASNDALRKLSPKEEETVEAVLEGWDVGKLAELFGDKWLEKFRFALAKLCAIAELEPIDLNALPVAYEEYREKGESAVPAAGQEPQPGLRFGVSHTARPGGVGPLYSVFGRPGVAREVAEMLLDYMKRRGVSIRSLSNQIGLSRGTIKRIINWKVGRIYGKTKAAIMEFFGLSAGFFKDTRRPERIEAPPYQEPAREDFDTAERRIGRLVESARMSSVTEAAGILHAAQEDFDRLREAWSGDGTKQMRLVALFEGISSVRRYHGIEKARIKTPSNAPDEVKAEEPPQRKRNRISVDKSQTADISDMMPRDIKNALRLSNKGLTRLLNEIEPFGYFESVICRYLQRSKLSACPPIFSERFRRVYRIESVKLLSRLMRRRCLVCKDLAREIEEEDPSVRAEYSGDDFEGVLGKMAEGKSDIPPYILIIAGEIDREKSGPYLRMLQRSSGKTRKDFVAAIGVSEAMLNNMCEGRSAVPDNVMFAAQNEAAKSANGAILKGDTLSSPAPQGPQAPSAEPRRVKTDPNMASFDEAQDAIPSDSRGMAAKEERGTGPISGLKASLDTHKWIFRDDKWNLAIVEEVVKEASRLVSSDINPVVTGSLRYYGEYGNDLDVSLIFPNPRDSARTRANDAANDFIGKLGDALHPFGAYIKDAKFDNLFGSGRVRATIVLPGDNGERQLDIVSRESTRDIVINVRESGYSRELYKKYLEFEYLFGELDRWQKARARIHSDDDVTPNDKERYLSLLDRSYDETFILQAIERFNRPLSEDIASESVISQPEKPGEPRAPSAESQPMRKVEAPDMEAGGEDEEKLPTRQDTVRAKTESVSGAFESEAVQARALPPEEIRRILQKRRRSHEETLTLLKFFVSLAGGRGSVRDIAEASGGLLSRGDIWYMVSHVLSEDERAELGIVYGDARLQREGAAKIPGEIPPRGDMDTGSLTAMGRKIASLRRAKGLTQTGLSKLSGMYLTHLKGIEAGLIHPTYRTIVAIAKELGAEVEGLGVEPPRKTEWEPIPAEVTAKIEECATLGEQIRLVLKYRECSVRKAAKIIGISRMTLGEVLGNKRAVQKKTVELVAERLGVDSAVLKASKVIQRPKNPPPEPAVGDDTGSYSNEIDAALQVRALCARSAKARKDGNYALAMH